MARPHFLLPGGLAGFAALMLVRLSASAAEPYVADASGHSGSFRSTVHIDHLLPVEGDGMVQSGGDYLAQFAERSFLMGVDPSTIPWREWSGYVVLFNAKNGRYILRAGPIPRKTPLQLKTPKGYTDAVISKSMADLICQIWMNTLLETHYERKWISWMPHDTSFYFSACTGELGELAGTARGANMKQGSPPSWLAGTGNELVNFVCDAKRDPKKMEADLAGTRDRLFHYVRWHGIK